MFSLHYKQITASKVMSQFILEIRKVHKTCITCRAFEQHFLHWYILTNSLMTYLKLFHVRCRSTTYNQMRERWASKKSRHSHSWFVQFLNQAAFIEQQ